MQPNSQSETGQAKNCSRDSPIEKFILFQRYR